MAQVFISYSRRDLSFVGRLVQGLERMGLDVWYDLSGLEGGERWGDKIQGAIRECECVIVVLSPDSVKSEWVEREFLFASNLKKKIIPLMYRECELPFNYLNLNYIDVQGGLYEQNFPKILKAINGGLLAANSGDNSTVRAAARTISPRSRQSNNTIKYVIGCGVIGLVGLMVVAVAGFWLVPKLFPASPAAIVNEPVPTALTPVIVPTTPFVEMADNSTLSSPTSIPGTSGNSTPPPAATSIVQDDFLDSRGIPMRLVSAGTFIMGSDNAADPADQKPLHMVNLDTYYIDKYEVTNVNYKACVDAGICQPPTQFDSETRTSYYGNSQFDNFPIIYVDWNMSKAYCEWRGARLPTEAEWEKAARGTDGRIYPWGNTENDCEKANHMGCVGDTSRVGSYEAGKSPYGVYDMVGNIWEWMADFYDANYYGLLPQNVLDPLGPNNGETHAMRGTSWHPYDYEVKVTRRGNRFPTELNDIFGFRCASDILP